jgi:hypothetical protein
MRYAIDVVAHWAAAYGARAQLCMIYIEEAHAQDEWPISSCRLSKKGLSAASAAGECGGGARGAPVIYLQQKTIGDRLAAARDFVRDYEVPLQPEAAPAAPGVLVVADQIANGFETTYAAWPLRWYIFRCAGPAGEGDVTVTHIGEPEDASFDLSEVEHLLLAEQSGAGAGAGAGAGGMA